MLLLLQSQEVTTENLLTSPGVIGTIFLIILIIFLGIFIFLKRLNIYTDLLKKNTKNLTEEEFEKRLINLDEGEVDKILELRKKGFVAKNNLVEEKNVKENCRINKKGC